MVTVKPAVQLAAMIEAYAPDIAQSFERARRKLRALFPRGYELVYENYNAVGVGYGAGEKASSVIVSLVAYPRWITLFFMHGVGLDDPARLLEGKGSRIRSVRLESPSDLDRPDVRRLLAQALAPHLEALRTCPRLRLVIKSIASKRRARRPAARNPAKPDARSRNNATRGRGTGS